MSEQVQYGWQCPICHRVYAPWMAQCLSCGENRTYFASSTGLRIGVDGVEYTEEEYAEAFGEKALQEVKDEYDKLRK